MIILVHNCYFFESLQVCKDPNRFKKGSKVYVQFGSEGRFPGVLWDIQNDAAFVIFLDHPIAARVGVEGKQTWVSLADVYADPGVLF